ncbi:MAG: sugar phosphate isomerase/epimerase [Meiothermus sp.]|uniref:sugar phosphate isomerase/epimerase family protein n=1 Tax=Meiothermus sp. TaxID=1955249 RepID=UPI0025E44A85|nr:sugar phosphate isomerase/epimerase family protein [Meiothermus sp.]MCS7194461.1 sugar phosphate isomerase/epimerase [Meiothermus sp.]MDW8091913.1 sugar phosphate isomerase/epimerase family protein [Meiothermus sp.]MDW8482336.1 sugar phosphate isomerase/epimerase family protein [Meiothermus sp.]
MRLGFSPFTTGLDYRTAFELAAELGLFLEIAYDQHEVDPRLPGAKELAEMGRSAGVGFTVHLPFVDWNLASLVPSVWRLSLERTQRALDFAGQIGAYCGVLHTGSVPLRHPEALAQARRLLERALSELEPVVPLALENLGLDEDDLLETPDELAQLLQAHPQHGFCLDVGHALVQLGLEGPQTYHQLLCGRLIHWHLHDNRGASDEHLPCGEGQVDWGWVRQALKGFSGTAALEVTGGAEGVRRSVALLQQP